MMRKLFLMLGTLVFLCSCAAVFSDQALRQVDPDLPFRAVLKDPDLYRGKVMLLGGQIIVTTVKEAITWVEVLQKPLDWYHRPKDTDVSDGRFLIRFDGFQDPAVYSSGRKITVVGEVEGQKILPIQQIQYTYPVLIPLEAHLWEPGLAREPRFHFGIGVGVAIN
ncbi:MAG: Slp family lipoprotein [Desulfobacterales bacterium]|nr:MAG: Slp family lipoprotein [Desulfobacterales bacterium]